MNCFALSFVLVLAAVAQARPFEEDHDPRPYKFAYGVSDHHTHDHHQQHEVRDGHVVRGSYSLKEADGTTRIVDYVAGPHSGFNAVVRRVGHAQHPQHYHSWANREQRNQNRDQEGQNGNGYENVGSTRWGSEGQGGEISQGGVARLDGYGNAESYVGSTHWGYNY